MGKTKELETKSIGSLLAQYSIPAVIAMIVNAIYNVVDRIFIGNYVGEAALAGLTIVFPLMMVIFAFAGLVGAGGAALMSIKLGEKNVKDASKVFGNSLGLSIIITGLTLVSIFFNLENLLYFFGAKSEFYVYAESYMSIILGGFIFQMVSFTLNSAVRTEGKPILSMIAMMASAISNITLDYILIVRFNMGVKGAAYATIAGQFVGLAILSSFYLRGKSGLAFKIRDLIPEWENVKEIFTIGFATFIGTLGNSIAATILNRSLGQYGGIEAITAMGAINSLYTFFIMPVMGIQQGMQPIVGYNYGANKMHRVFTTLKYALGVAIGFSLVVFLILETFPATFIGMFIDSNSPTMAIAIDGLRVYILMLPGLSINLLGIAFFQSTAKGKQSMYLSLLRQFIFLIPIILILPLLFGLKGVWLATPIADGLAILVTLIALIYNYRKHNGIKEEVSYIS